MMHSGVENRKEKDAPEDSRGNTAESLREPFPVFTPEFIRIYGLVCKQVENDLK